MCDLVTLRVFGHRVVREIFGLYTEEEEASNLTICISHLIRVIKSRRTGMAGRVVPYGVVVMYYANSSLMGKPEGMRRLGKSTCTWEENICIYLKQ
jgi:hypothetical protein